MKIKSKDKHPNMNPLKWTHIISNFPLGMVVGAWAALIFAWFIDAEVAAVLSGKYIGPLVTFVAALLALASALWTIQSHRDIVQEDRERKLAAARASMPLVLSEFNYVCKAHVKHLVYDTVLPDSEAKLREGVQETLKHVIEHADHERQKKLSDLLNFYQISIARYSYLVGSEGSKSDDERRKLRRAEAIIYWVSLKAFVDEQFAFARGADDDKPPRDVRAAFESDLQSAHMLGEYDCVVRAPRWLSDPIVKKHLMTP